MQGVQPQRRLHTAAKRQKTKRQNESHAALHRTNGWGALAMALTLGGFGCSNGPELDATKSPFVTALPTSDPAQEEPVPTVYQEALLQSELKERVSEGLVITPGELGLFDVDVRTARNPDMLAFRVSGTWLNPIVAIRIDLRDSLGRPLFQNFPTTPAVTYDEDPFFHAQGVVSGILGRDIQEATFRAVDESGRFSSPITGQVQPTGDLFVPCSVPLFPVYEPCTVGLVCKPTFVTEVSGRCEPPSGKRPSIGEVELLDFLGPQAIDCTVPPNFSAIRWRLSGDAAERIISATLQTSVVGVTSFNAPVDVVTPIENKHFFTTLSACTTFAAAWRGQDVIFRVRDEAGRASIPLVFQMPNQPVVPTQ